MPDQYDPKVSPRPTADRRQADARRGATMADDPLAELAKIVQGRPTNSAAQPSRQAPAAPPPNSNQTSDLEAELLNDLQASFAAVRDVFPPPPPPAQPARQAAPAARAPVVVDEAPVAAAPPPQPAPPPAATPPPPRNDTGSELRDEFRLEPVDQTRLVPIPSPPVIQPVQMAPAPAPQPRPPAERPAMERKPEPPPAKIAEPPPMERAPAKPRQPPATPDLGAFQLRGSAAPPPATPASVTPNRQPHSRWEQPEAPRAQPAAASRFAPPRTAAPQMEDEPDLDPFAEGGLFADQLDPPELEEEFQLEDLGTLPAYADDEHLPPLDDDLESLAPRRGVSRNLVIVLGVVLVALVGGVGFAMFNGGSTAITGGTPPVIAADGNPTKITPDDTTAANDPDGQNKLIYDRVNSGDQANTDTTLLTPDNGPIKDVGSDTANSAISRVIIPGGPGIDAPGTNNSATQPDQQAAAPPATTTTQPDAIGQVAANDATVAVDPDAIQPIGPRKVRTVVVKPDGTIISSAATDAGIAPEAAAPAATSNNTAAAKPAATSAEPAPAVVDDTAAIAGNNSDALPITAPSSDGTTAAADAAPAPATPVVEAPPAVAKPAATKPAATKPAATKPAAAQQVATADAADDSSPIDIVPGTTAAPAASGVLVQISSQRTEDAARATYRDLQARYPNILGSYSVNVQRADVPDRGTFYRVRVGPFSQNDAQRLCDDLRQAGGDCVLAKR